MAHPVGMKVECELTQLSRSGHLTCLAGYHQLTDTQRYLRIHNLMLCII